MIGRKLEEFFPKETVSRGRALLEVKNLKNGAMVRGVDFTAYAGEILGFAGLIGSGRTETMLSLYLGGSGISGEIKIDDKKFTPASPGKSRKKGFAFIPEDRRNEGIVGGLTIAQNLSLAYTESLAKIGIINKKLENQKSEKIIRDLSIMCIGPKQLVSELSGGNQQKIVIGRWLDGNAKIFIFDQPTTGVDVGAKTEIYRQMVKLAKSGCAVIFISSENEELLGMCDRILVMAKGHVVKEFYRDEATEEQLLSWTSGGE
jgi:ribose transport system ATP-binding protein